MPAPSPPARVTLLQKQHAFAVLAAQLILRATELGYDVTLGEAWRSPEEAARLAKAGKGIVNSLHIKRLAIDLNLFQRGQWLIKTEEYAILGQWWEQQSRPPDLVCAWGGRFSHPDGGHFSIRYGQRA